MVQASSTAVENALFIFFIPVTMWSVIKCKDNEPFRRWDHWHDSSRETYSTWESQRAFWSWCGPGGFVENTGTLPRAVKRNTWSLQVNTTVWFQATEGMKGDHAVAHKMFLTGLVCCLCVSASEAVLPSSLVDLKGQSFTNRKGPHCHLLCWSGDPKLEHALHPAIIYPTASGVSKWKHPYVNFATIHRPALCQLRQMEHGGIPLFRVKVHRTIRMVDEGIKLFKDCLS